MRIKILGSGCAKCNRLEQLTRDALAELGLVAEIEHVRDIDKIMAYPVMTTPALVIDEQVRVAGHLPGKAEIVAWLQETRS